MSLQAYSAVWADMRLRNGALIVAMAIADFAWDDGWAFPSVDAIAEKARLTPRRCFQVIATLEAMGVLVVVTGGGWKGTNLYGLTTLTKGAFNPPTPSEIESAMRTKRQPTARRRAHGGGEKISGGVKKFHPEIKVTKISPEPYRTLTPPKEGVSASDLEALRNSVPSAAGPIDQAAPSEPVPGPVEWPSQDDVLLEASKYPGSMARGIPAKIPAAWALDWWGYCTFRRQQFSPHWPTEFVFRFERDWQDGHAKARGITPVNGAKRELGVWELKQVLEELKKRAADHPANENSAAYLSDVSPEERLDYQNLQTKIRQTEQALAEKTPTLPPAA